MTTFKPFKGLRPTPSMASQVAAPPYDVLNSDEARHLVKGNPWSFLHVTKSEIDLPPETDHYSPAVYQKAHDNLEKMIREHVLISDTVPCYYLYRQVMDGHAQTGIVGVASVDEYLDGTIKIHEQTREDKELDRINHVKGCKAQTGPVFLVYQDHAGLHGLVERFTRDHAPTCDFVAADGVRHVLWVVTAGPLTAEIEEMFGQIPSLYVADGHHRSAAAVKVAKERARASDQMDPEAACNFFLAVSFPASQLRIFDYNRYVKDLNGLNEADFLAKISQNFTCIRAQASGPCQPKKQHEFGMYLGGMWYQFNAKSHCIHSEDPIQCLDVYILQHYVLDPVLAIKNPRTDKRIDFIGGIRGLSELEKRWQEAGQGVAFAMHPTSMDQLMRVADAKLLMPPKSTWFEPKLRCGMVTHQIG